jgi:hypothetical protein
MDNQTDSQTVVTKKSTNHDKAIAYLESCCPKLVQIAQERNDWEVICKNKFPTLAAEQLAVFLAIKDTNAAEVNGTIERAVVRSLKRVKRHLIWRNMTLLEAFENSMLQSSIEFCQKQDAVKPIAVHATDFRLKDTSEDIAASG